MNQTVRLLLAPDGQEFSIVVEPKDTPPGGPRDSGRTTGPELDPDPRFVDQETRGWGLREELERITMRVANPR